MRYGPVFLDLGATLGSFGNFLWKASGRARGKRSGGQPSASALARGRAPPAVWRGRTLGIKEILWGDLRHWDGRAPNGRAREAGRPGEGVHFTGKAVFCAELWVGAVEEEPPSPP